ncbi:ABC transporter permease [Inhella sp.]|uniref:ABC transporter permease n=1 Tax=Inhella sp. TaxID=1921806 RepID=UPI0035B3C88A
MVLGPSRALHLAWPLARRDIAARYRGSMAGLLWTLIGPLAMVAIYAAVFQGVFKARWPGSGGAETDGLAYALRLFAGLIVFGAFSEVAGRATRLMQDNASLVKRVVFPLELLALALVLQVAVHMAVQLGLLTLLAVLTGAGLQASLLWLLVLLPWVLALLLAAALALSALGCYLRDLQHLVPLAMSGLLFLSPVFYPLDQAPELLRGLLWLNPLTAPIEAMRAAWFGLPMNLELLGLQALATALALPLALLLFRRLRPGFADLV